MLFFVILGITDLTSIIHEYNHFVDKTRLPARHGIDNQANQSNCNRNKIFKYN